MALEGKGDTLKSSAEIYSYTVKTERLPSLTLVQSLELQVGKKKLHSYKLAKCKY